VLAALLAACSAAPAHAPQISAPQTCSGETREETQIEPGVTWIHFCREVPANPNAAPAAGMPLGAPAGPWSIHILEFPRHRREIELRSRVGLNGAGKFTRVPVTELASRAAAEGEDVIAAINGDYDMADPYLGLPIGLAVSDGKLWSGGGPPRPAMTVVGSGTPAIGVPEFTMRLDVRNNFLTVDTFNKPMAYSEAHHLRAYTRAFGSEVKAARPFRALVLAHLGSDLPPQSRGVIRARVSEIRAASDVQPIPVDGILIAEFPEGPNPKEDVFRDVKIRERVNFDTWIRMENSGDVQQAIGGLPLLVSGGAVSISGEGEPGAYLKARHPRTAVCYTEDDYIFAVVDGRQPKLSVGMTLEELADFMLSLGCIEAMNADGGGSTELAVALPANAARPSTLPPAAGSRLTIVNSPSDGLERGRPNAWLIVQNK